MTYSIPESYELVKQETLKELNSEAYILRHKKSGARLFLLSNDDENKVFTYRIPHAARRQHRAASYSGALRALRVG